MDIVNFDAFAFMDKMVLYPEEVRSFLNRGGTLAWGMVPTSKAVRGESAESLFERFEKGVARLEQLGVEKERLLTQCLVTPACGMGGLSEEDTLRILSLTRALSLLLRQKNFTS